MPMLWLNHQSFSSLKALRQTFRESHGTEQAALRADLLSAAENGRFGSWLSVQPEMRGSVSKADWASQAQELLCGARVVMREEVSALLERICGIPFTGDASGHAPGPGEKQSKAALLRQQEWMNAETAQELDRAADWRYVITSQGELLKALLSIRSTPQSSHMLYLCAVSGRQGWYRINLKGICNTVICGFGSPRVLHTGLDGNEVIDLGAQNLRCEGFELKCVGREALSNTIGRCTNFAQTVL